MAGVKTVKKGDRLIKEYVDKAGKIVKYEPGLKLEVSDFKGAWYPAKVLEVDEAENEVLVHYDKWSSRFDEWIKTDSNRLRPSSNTNVIQIQYKVGERVEALWSTDGLRYPGRIKAVLPNDYYEVLFDDGIKCKKKGSQIYKIQRITRGKAQELDKKQKRNSISGGASNELVAPTEPPLVKSPAKQKGVMEPASIPEDSVGETGEESLAEAVPVVAELEVAEPPLAEVESPLPVSMPAPPPETPDVGVSPLSLTMKVSPSTAAAAAAAVATPPLELGKRKRACHNYSLFLKVPRKSPKPENTVPKRKYVRREPEPVVVPEEGDQQDEEPAAPSTSLGEPEVPVAPTAKKGKKSLKPAEVAADTSPMAPPQKRPRKYTARSSLSLSSSESMGIELKLNGSGEPHADSVGPRFIDEQGNEVVVQQNADGAWICPIDNCGKIFRKDSLLQMHLQHYHPESNIKFLGKKLNVFEMAMEKAQKSTDSTYEVREKEHADTSNAEQSQTTKRRRSAQVTPVPSQPSTPAPSTPTTFIHPPITAEVVVKLTDIKADLERRDGKKFDEKHPDIIVEGSFHRVSKRGRPLHSRTWSKEHTAVEDLSSDEDFKPDISRYKRTGSKRPQVIISDDETTVQPSSNATSSHVGSFEEQAVAEAVSQKLPQKTERSKRYKPLRKQQARPVFLTQRRRQKIAEQSAAENIKARKLEVINDELYKAGYKKRLKIQPTFEDVKVDVINCICSVKEEFGLMMQCELCQAWQHGNCYGVYEVTQLPPYYVCSYCRSPNSIRNSRKYEWYQEVNTTGKLPRFTFCPIKDEPAKEEKMQGCNDLLNALASLQSMMRSTQVKISSLNTPGQTAVEDAGDDPSREAISDDFKANFRPVLKHLLRCNRHDQSYIDKLRHHVVETLSTRKEVTVGKNVAERLHSRAAKVVKQKWGSKLQQVQIHPVISSELGNTKSAFASCVNSDVTSLEQRDEKPSELAAFRNQLQSKLAEMNSILIDSEDEQRKFVLLSLDDVPQIPQTEGSPATARLVVHAENGEVIGMGGTEKEDLHQGVHVVKVKKCDPETDGCRGPMCSNSTSVMPAGKLSSLYLCSVCKSSLGVQWNKADFVASERLQISFVESSEKKNTGAGTVSADPQEPSWPSLKELSMAKMKDLNVALPELGIANQPVESISSDTHETTIVCPEHHANLKTRIIREQALLDSYLDTIEIKLKELENSEPCDTESLLGKLKDLQELKAKVDQINESMSLLREREASHSQKQTSWASAESTTIICP